MRKILISLSVLSVIGSGYLLQKKSSSNRVKELKDNSVEPPEQETTLKVIRGYNWESGYRLYSDEEIRMLREKQSYQSDGSYIYTPGRYVPTREEEIEQYLEDNPEVIEEIYDKYRP